MAGAIMKLAFDSLETLTAKFCDDFTDELVRRAAQRYVPQLGVIVGFLFRELCDRASEQVVRETFGEYGPKGPREESERRRRRLLVSYVVRGKPPKKTFAKAMARWNAQQIEDGTPAAVIGSGTPDPDLMYDYLKKTLRQKKYRNMLDEMSTLYEEELRKEQASGRVRMSLITPWGKFF
jgi:hypothetical protein